MNNKHCLIDDYYYRLWLQHPEFCLIIHTELKTTLLKENFAPGDACHAKPHKGLGPLVMLAQTPQVISKLDSDVTNQDCATTTMATDYNRRKQRILPLSQNATETIYTVFPFLCLQTAVVWCRCHFYFSLTK